MSVDSKHILSKIIKMKQITIDIPDSKYSFFLELITNLGFVANDEKKILDEKSHPVYKSLEQGFKEMEKVKNGTLKTKALKEFLDEI